MRSLCAMLVPALAVTLIAGVALADERKEVAERAGCKITVGDRDDHGTDLIIATCHWPIAASKITPVVRAAETHDFLSSVGTSTKLPDGRIHQLHKASGISDREITLDFKNETLPSGDFKTSWTRAAKQEPIGEDSVQVPIDDGYWQVHDNGNGTSIVIYGLRYSAGGRVPSFLVRSFQKGGIADLVEEMREQVE